MLAPHVSAEQRLSYEHVLALSGSLLLGSEPGEYVVEIFDAEVLRHRKLDLPYWERSGGCRAWWVEGEPGFHNPDAR